MLHMIALTISIDFQCYKPLGFKSLQNKRFVCTIILNTTRMVNTKLAKGNNSNDAKVNYKQTPIFCKHMHWFCWFEILNAQRRENNNA